MGIQEFFGSGRLTLLMSVKLVGYRAANRFTSSASINIGFLDLWLNWLPQLKVNHQVGSDVHIFLVL